MTLKSTFLNREKRSVILSNGETNYRLRGWLASGLLPILAFLLLPLMAQAQGLIITNPTVNFSFSSMNSNTAITDGGAIYYNIANGVMNIGYSIFNNNNAGGNGGGLYTGTNCTLTVNGSTFAGNTAGSDGGAIYLGDGSNANITGSTFTGNTAGGDGGAIYVGLGCTVVIDDCLLSGNSATNGSGIYIGAGSTVTIQNGSIIDGIHNEGTLILENGVTINGGITGSGTVTFISAITFATTSLPNAGFEAAYSQSIAAGANGVLPYHFALDGASALPAGLSLSTTGVISGVPTVGGVTRSFRVILTDGAGRTVTQTFTLTVMPIAPYITGPAWMTLTRGYAATSVGPYSISGSSPVTVTKRSGHELITWNNATKMLDIAAGLPAGVYAVELRATNAATSWSTQRFELTVKEPAYWIEIGTYAAGTITSDPQYIAEEGQTVTLTLTPDAGRAFEAIEVFNMDNRNVRVALSGTGNKRTFTMPAHHVIITATTVGNEDIQTGGLKAYVQGGTLYISGATEGRTLKIYNLAGALIYKGIANGSEMSVALPGRGVYIVGDGYRQIKIVN